MHPSRLPSSAVIVVLAVAAGVAALVPAWYVRNAAGSEWRGVQPELVSDSLYYYAQMREVADGYPLVGNPFFREYRENLPPAFFMPVAISAIPMLVGVPLQYAAPLNHWFWSVLLFCGAYALLRLLGLARWAALAGVLFVGLQTYMFMVRPVAMQLVFPAFVAFCISYAWWLRKPERYSGLLLCAVIGASPYVYPFLAYIVGLTMAITTLFYTATQDWKRVQQLLAVGLGSVALAIPFLLFMAANANLPWHAESLGRIGLTPSRIPSMEIFYYGRWIGIALAALAVLHWRRAIAIEHRIPLLFFSATGSALLLLAGSNIITGKQAFFAIHAGRFINLWMALAAAYLLYRSYRAFCNQENVYRLGAAGLLVLVLLAGIARNSERSIAFLWQTMPADVIAVQHYHEPLAWLEDNAPPYSVVWSNDRVAEYVPILTSHYNFFVPAGVLQIVPTAEIEDRYLLSRFEAPTLETLHNDLLLYAGAGRYREQPAAHNRSAAVCRLLRKDGCAEPLDNLTLAGEAYFTRLQARGIALRQAMRASLAPFAVDYLVIEKGKDAVPAGVLLSERWSNDAFTVYELAASPNSGE